jgi:ribonuclease BN (tRNA processing enzyme)
MKEIDTINYNERVDNLFLTIYLIGYSGEGESILFTISSTKPENRLFYIGIIDSYAKNDINITIDLLKKLLDKYNLKNKKLDFLCWTHPHDDHTKGMVGILKKYCNTKTLISTPNVFYMKEALSDESNKVINYIFNLNYNKHVKNRSKLEILTGEDRLQIINIGEGRNKWQMVIENYGPYPNIAYMQNPDKTIDLNKLSTSLMLTFNGIKIFLGGDVQDMSIKSFVNFPDKINFIKIPHHTSTTSTYLTKLLKNVELTNIACTTVFNNGKLPEKKLLLKYINLSEKVFCTSKTNVNRLRKAAPEIDRIIESSELTESPKNS